MLAQYTKQSKLKSQSTLNYLVFFFRSRKQLRKEKKSLQMEKFFASLAFAAQVLAKLINSKPLTL